MTKGADVDKDVGTELKALRRMNQWVSAFSEELSATWRRDLTQALDLQDTPFYGAI